MTTPEPQPKKHDPTKEYVAGSSFAWSRGALRTLPYAIDDLSRDLGDDVYEKMLNDAQVQANLTVYKANILEDGATLHSAVQDKDKDGYDQAAELVTFCEAVLDDMEVSLDDALWSQLDALMLGCKVAEEVYAVNSSYTGKAQYILRALKVKPRKATAFVVDAYDNPIGLLGVTPDRPSLSMGGIISREQLLPREKFAVFTFRPKDSDIRGTTIGRAAYNPWYLKQQTWPQYFKYLLQFASPSLIGKTAEDAANEIDENGVTITAVQALLNKLMEFQNGTALVIPFGADVKEIFSSGDGAAFLRAFELFDRQITTAMLAQTRATMEAQHGSKADSQTAADVLATMIRQTRKALARMLRRDVLRDLVRYNYGDEAARLTPRVSFGETEQQDVAPLMTAIAALERVSYLDPSQLPGIDVLLNLPERSPEDLKRRKEQAENPPQPTPGQSREQSEEQADEADKEEEQTGARK